jgi:CrcB protein
VRVTTLAMLAGGILGVLLRNLLEGPRRSEPLARWRSLAISVIGGLVLGALTGAAVIGVAGDGAAAALGVGLSGALMTYCLFGSAATELIKLGPSRQTLLPAITSALTAFAAATAGVVLGVILAG